MNYFEENIHKIMTGIIFKKHLSLLTTTMIYNLNAIFKLLPEHLMKILKYKIYLNAASMSFNVYRVV